MANSGSETNELTDDAERYNKLQLKTIDDVRKLDKEELVVYVKKLHKTIVKTTKKLKKTRRNLKNLQKSNVEVKSKPVLEQNPPEAEEEAVKTEKKEADAPPGSKESQSDDILASAAFSFVDEMRQVAEQAQNLKNFVYEPTSGMYYDPKTGYYYNAEYGLYYDGNSGCYYRYNQDKNMFEFHSRAQVQENKTSAKVGDSGKDNADAADAGADEIDEVEFDEYGGVILDRDMLKQIKAQKHKDKQRHVKNKKKSNKKKEKKHKSKSREERHKAKARRKQEKRAASLDSGHPRKRFKLQNQKDLEDGELSASSSDSGSSSSASSKPDQPVSDTESNDGNGVPVFKAGGRFQDMAKKYPPSLRIIVQETTIEELKIGSLHLITYKGGTLGREGAHDVIIPDFNVSKSHLKFVYDTKYAIYKCVDLGSRNGTMLNGLRMSVSKSQSRPYDLVHGSIIQIGLTKLLCHVHEGNSTCGLCEPGLLIEKPPREVSTSSSVALTHKEQLKLIQRKYGLENEKFVESKTNAGAHYNDRAATRRNKVGSSNDKEKTEVASINTEISSQNKGFKMLSKLGWSKGEALGKSKQSGGLLEPIKVISNEGTAGLGSDKPTSSHAYTSADKQKFANLKITQERYKRAEIFVESVDSD